MVIFKLVYSWLELCQTLCRSGLVMATIFNFCPLESALFKNGVGSGNTRWSPWPSLPWTQEMASPIYRQGFILLSSLYSSCVRKKYRFFNPLCKIPLERFTKLALCGNQSVRILHSRNHYGTGHWDCLPWACSLVNVYYFSNWIVFRCFKCPSGGAVVREAGSTLYWNYTLSSTLN